MGKKNRLANHSGIITIKNSKSKSNKHVKRGEKGKDCIYFNDEKLTCDNRFSGYYRQFCQLSYCGRFKPKESKVNNELSDYDESYIQPPDKASVHEFTNEYIGLSKNIGTPCHIDYLKSKGCRRHRARCIYYDKIKKFCGWFMTKCTGSSHCDKYKEKEWYLKSDKWKSDTDIEFE
ncbi:hypothetical protein [Anaerotignum sp.]|uniref:hypothetical protein n=1 Tax=Anaerotignum sp. TaxID=2039241 RepID=UPI00289BAF6C|nr:hypothetical protein [Anaerotignum sp.]